MPAIKNVNPTTNTPWYADPQKLMKGADTGSSDANIVDTPKAPEESIPELQGAIEPKPIAANQLPNDFAPIATAQAAGVPNDFAPISAVPPAFIDRIKQGHSITDHVTSLASQAGAAGWDEAKEQAMGAWNLIKNGYSDSHSGDFISRMLAVPKMALGVFDTAMLPFSVPAGIVGKGVEESTGGLLTKQNFETALMGLRGGKSPLVPKDGGEFTRLRTDPVTGAVKSESVGPLPEQRDFQVAQSVLSGGENAPQVAPKLERAWKEDGITPAEVVHDGQVDPTIKQSMLSADPGDYPDAYQFHGYEPTEKTLGELEATRAHIDVTLPKTPVGSLEPYFENVPGKGQPKTAQPIMQGGGEVEAGGAPLGEFEIKPTQEPTDQSGLMPQGKSVVEHSEAEQAILDKISVGERTEKRQLTWDGLYTNFIDKLFPISKAVKESGLDLATENNPYQRSRLLTGYVGKADHFLNNGTFDFNTYENNGPSLKEILSTPVPGKNMVIGDDLRSFTAYITARRAVELEGRDIESGFAKPDLEHAKTTVSEGAGFYEKPRQALFDYQKRVATYLRDSGVLSNSGYKAMLEANQMYVPFSRVMGLDETAGARGGSSLQAHNPIKTIKGSSRDIVDPIESIVRNTYHFMEMSERNVVGTKLIDMLKSISKEFPEAKEGAVAQAIKENPRASAMADTLSEIGIKKPDELANALAHAAEPTKNGEIAILRDGKRETYAVDHDLARAMKGLDAQSMGMLERIISIPANTLRAGAIINPDFAVRHTIRDFLYAFATSKDGVFTPVDMARGFSGLWTKDADYWNWLKGGGGNISYIGVDRRYLQNDIRKLTGDTGLTVRAWNVMTDPEASMWQKAGAPLKLPIQLIDKFALDPLRSMVMFAENASHLGAFKKGMRAAEAAAEPADFRSQVLGAAWKSRDTAVDAMRMGASMRAYNMITAFANIKLQDTDRIVRALMDNPASTLIKIGGAITVPSMILWGINHDDPDYQEIAQWEKDLFFIVPIGSTAPSKLHIAQARERGVPPTNSALFFLRLPKPWAMGMIFGSLVERLMDEFIAHKPGAFKDFFKSLYQTSGPDFVPTAAAPIIDQFANRSTFTNRTLIPQQMEKFLPEYQYTPYTTELTKALGRVIGAFPGMSELKMEHSGFGGAAKAVTSPIIMENYIRGWTGNLGIYALNATDAALRKTGVLPDPIVPTSRLGDIPFVKSFVVRYPSATTESIQTFYDNHEKQKSYFDTLMAKAKEGDVAAVKHIREMGGIDMFNRLDGISKALGIQSKTVSNIYKNQTVPADQKRQLIDSIYFSMIQMAQYGNRALEKIKK